MALLTLPQFLEQLSQVKSASSAWALAQTHAAALPHSYLLVASGSPVLDETLLDKLVKIDPGLVNALVTNPALSPDLANYLAHQLTDALVPGPKHADRLALTPYAVGALRTLISQQALPPLLTERLYRQAISQPTGADLPLCGQALRVTLDRADLSSEQLVALATRWALTKTIWLAIKAHPNWPQPTTWLEAVDTVSVDPDIWGPLFNSFPDLITRPLIQEWLATDNYYGLDDALVLAARKNVANPLFTSYFRVFAKRDPFLAARTLRSVPSSVTVILDPMDLKPLLTHADKLVREIGLATAKRLHTRRQITKKGLSPSS